MLTNKTCFDLKYMIFQLCCWKSVTDRTTLALYCNAFWATSTLCDCSGGLMGPDWSQRSFLFTCCCSSLHHQEANLHQKVFAMQVWLVKHTLYQPRHSGSSFDERAKPWLVRASHHMSKTRSLKTSSPSFPFYFTPPFQHEWVRLTTRWKWTTTKRATKRRNRCVSLLVPVVRQVQPSISSFHSTRISWNIVSDTKFWRRCQSRSTLMSQNCVTHGITSNNNGQHCTHNWSNVHAVNNLALCAFQIYRSFFDENGSQFFSTVLLLWLC